MDSLFKISQQTFWQLLGKVVTSLSTFIVLGFVSRNYGTEEIGVFTLSLTYLATFYLLADFGFNAHVLKNLTENQWRKLLGVRLIWSLSLIVISFRLLPLLPFTDSEFNQAVIFGSLSIIGSAIFTTSNLIFQNRHRYDLSTLATTVGIIIGLGLYIWLIFLKLKATYLLVANSLSWLIMALASLLLIKKILPSISPIFDLAYFKKLFKESWPISVTLTLNVVYFRADSFIVTYYKGISEAGIYNVAYAIFQTALVLPSFVMNAYYPLLLKSASKVKLIGLILSVLSLAGVILTILLAPLIIMILTGGKGFIGSVKSLQILSLGFPAFFLSSLMMWLLVKKGQYKKILLIYFFGLVINVILNLLFIPQFSYIGASWTTILSEYLILILLLASL